MRRLRSVNVAITTAYIRSNHFMGSSRSGLLPKKPKELLPLPPRQRLQQRPHQSLDLDLTVFLTSRLAHFLGPFAPC